MRQFETKLTLRIYDTKLIEKMNMIMKFNPNRYQSKNQLLLELLELGVREKLKEFPTPPTTPVAAANAIPISHECNCNAETLKQIKELIEGMHLYNKQNVEGLLAHAQYAGELVIEGGYEHGELYEPRGEDAIVLFHEIWGRYDAFVKDEKTGRYIPADETERQLEMG